MKRLISLIITTVLILSIAVIPAYAAEENGTKTTEDGVYTYEVVNDKYVRLLKCLSVEKAQLNDDGSYTIPSEIEGKPVRYIGKKLYADSNAPAAKLIIPDSVTHIEGNFAETVVYRDDPEEPDDEGTNVSIIREIVLPDTLTYIGGSAFHRAHVERLIIPDSVVYIGDYAFSGTAIKELTIPENVRYLGKAVCYNTHLKSAKIEAPINEIKELSFAECFNLESVEMPDTVTKIGSVAFNITKINSFTFEHPCEVGNKPFNEKCTLNIKYSDENREGNENLIYGLVEQNLYSYTYNINYVLPNENGKTYKFYRATDFRLKVDGANASDWKSDNPKVAKITSNGKLYLLTQGQAKITATLDDGTEFNCVVKNIHNPCLTKKNGAEIYKNQTIKLHKGSSCRINIKYWSKGLKNVYKSTKYAKIIGRNNLSWFKIKGLKKGTTTVKVMANGKWFSIKVRVE